MGVAASGAYWVTALRALDSGSEALLAHIGPGGVGGVRPLGVVHGDAAPPRLAVSEKGVFVALQDADASGFSSRVARVPDALDGAIAWAEGPHQSGDRNRSFDFAASGESQLLVWDEWNDAGNHGTVVGAVVGLPNSVGVAAKTRELSLVDSAGLDAEAPRIVRRPGGYWLAWLVNAASSPSGAEARPYDPEGGEANQDFRELRSSRAYGARWIETQPLDESGRSLGEPVVATPREERVVGFDIVSNPEGRVWIAWRQGAASPAASGGKLAVLELREDGTRVSQPVATGALGAGEPTWLGSEHSRRRRLSFADDSDEIRFLDLSAIPSVASETAPLSGDWAGSAVLAALGDTLLLAAPRGRAVDLVVADCGEPKAPSVGSAPP